jgi:Cu2+-exporting ATPase
MKQYEVTGMSCAACSARVEKAVSKVPGVTSCSVSLLTNSMGVEGTATDQEIVNAVVAAGYGAAPKGAKKEQAAAEEEEALKDHETPKLRKRLTASVIFLVVLMYFSMGHMMWGWPVPAAMKDNHVAMGLLQMLLTIIVMVINQKFFVSGFTSLLQATSGDLTAGIAAGPLIAGFLASFITGCLACKFMIEVVKRGKLIWFAVYCTVAGLVSITSYFC